MTFEGKGMALKAGVGWWGGEWWGGLQTRACSRGRERITQTESVVMEWCTWGRSVGLREAEVGNGFQVEVKEDDRGM